MADLTTSAVSMSSGNNNAYDIFINYRFPDVGDPRTLATDIYNRLCKDFRVFLGVKKTCQIEAVIRTASVHIAIFSPGYAGSTDCLDQLLLMLKTRQTIIPVFYGVEPSQLKRTHDVGSYAEDLKWKENQGADEKFIGEWRKALDDVPCKKDLNLSFYNGDKKKLVNAIVDRVKGSIRYDVFINNDPDPVIQNRFASHLYRSLLFNGRRVFVDRNFIPQIKRVIKKASVRIAILSTKYVDSDCCLNELLHMVNSEGTIIPVFYGVKPSEVRWQIGAYSKLCWQNGVYDLLLRMLRWKHSKIGHEARVFESYGVENWKKALFKVAGIVGFELEDCNGDEGLLVNKIVQRVLSYENETGRTTMSYDVFISHRGPDSKKTLASHLYYRLVERRLRPFLDREVLQKGQELEIQIKKAIANASVHIVIFSETYGESEWCMNELEGMLETRAPIIPVFYNVESSDLLAEYHDGERIYSRALLKLKEATESPRFPDLITRLYNRLVKGVRSESKVPRYKSSTIENWSKAIFEVARKRGAFNLKEHNGDEGMLLDNVVNEVAQLVLYKRSIPSWVRAKRSRRNNIIARDLTSCSFIQAAPTTSVSTEPVHEETFAPTPWPGVRSTAGDLGTRTPRGKNLAAC